MNAIIQLFSRAKAAIVNVVKNVRDWFQGEVVVTKIAGKAMVHKTGELLKETGAAVTVATLFFSSCAALVVATAAFSIVAVGTGIFVAGRRVFEGARDTYAWSRRAAQQGLHGMRNRVSVGLAAAALLFGTILSPLYRPLKRVDGPVVPTTVAVVPTDNKPVET